MRLRRAGGLHGAGTLGYLLPIAGPACRMIRPLRPPGEISVCNLYSHTKGPKAIRELAKAMSGEWRNSTGNLEPQPSIFPDQLAPVVRSNGEMVARELIKMRWGFPQPPAREGEKARSGYVTNVRNTRSGWWKPWLVKPENRCLVPVTSFCEPDNRAKLKDPKAASVLTWFARDKSRPLFFFAGIWRPWTGHRGTKANPAEGDHLLYSVPHHRAQQRDCAGPFQGHAGAASDRE